jgi:hypothetical protein
VYEFFLPRQLYENKISLKDIIYFNKTIKGEINQAHIKILKIPMVDHFNLRTLQNDTMFMKTQQSIYEI